jgi:hypothetical protein
MEPSRASLTWIWDTIPRAGPKEDALPKSYSFTSDYLMYRKCPRQYMIFRKFGFRAIALANYVLW